MSLTHHVLFPEYFYRPLPPPTQGLCVGMYSTCEVHAKYALVQSDASTPLLVTHFQRSLGSKWPKFNDIFQPKKSSTTQLLLASTGHILVDEQEPSKGGSARRRKKIKFKFWGFWGIPFYHHICLSVTSILKEISVQNLFPCYESTRIFGGVLTTGFKLMVTLQSGCIIEILRLCKMNNFPM